MQIRTRLTLQFLLIGAIIMILASVSIYFFSAKYRQQAFLDRLQAKARITANLLLKANLNVAMLKQLERTNPVNISNEKIIILNALDDTVFTTDDNKEIRIRFDVLQTIRSGKQIYYRQDKYEIMGSLYQLVANDRFVVLSAGIDAEGLRHLEKLRIILILVYLISLILLTIAGWLYAGRALKPISDVVDRVDEISVTSLDLRINEGNGKDELGRLARTFNRMLTRLEKSFAVQKDFIANASHELRTPLTSINGQLDVLLMKDRTNDAYKTAVSSVLDDTRTLIDLSNKLLLIARTSAEGPVNFSSRARIDEILWQSRDDVLRFNKNYHVNIKLDESLDDENKLTVAGEESLLKVAFSNVIDNACKYSDDHTVHISVKNLENSVRIIFRDYGIGIPEDEQKNIFEPFYRSRNAKTYSGSGIGLPLVKQIVENHNGTITLTSEIGNGTQIILTFPLSVG